MREITRRGIGIYDSDPILRSSVLEEALLGAVVACAGEPGEVDEDGDFGGWAGLRWEIEVQGHLAAGGRGIVGELQELAAERGDCRGGSERHRVWFVVIERPKREAGKWGGFGVRKFK